MFVSIVEKRQIFSAKRMVYRRRDLRQKSTTTEGVLWGVLRRNSLGCKFKRQFSIDNYVIDFYCPDFRLAVELDGEIHRQRKGYDIYRTRTLNAYGVTEIRFSNEEVLENLKGVVSTIKGKLTSPRPSPKLRRGN